MILNSLLSVGALSLTAQAFLVLPEVNSIPEIETSEAKVPTSLNGEPQRINIDCSTCPFALNSYRNGQHEWTADVKSVLEMVVVSDGETLRFNEVPFYPTPNPPLPPTLFVAQTKKEGEESTMAGYEGPLRVSYSMEHEIRKSTDGNNEVKIIMTLMGLDGQMVKIDDLEMKVVTDAEGKLTLQSVNVVPASPNAPDAKCENILCRVFTKVITGMNKAKASAKSVTHRMKCLCMKCLHKLTGHKHHNSPHHQGHKGGMPHRLPDGTMVLPSHIQFKPAGHHGQHHQHHSGFVSKMAMVLKTTVKVVLVPILIGVAFGMAASAIGMLVGQAIVFVWMKFRRTPETGAYAPINSDEKEAPPAYQDVQIVEAVSEKEVEAKA